MQSSLLADDDDDVPDAATVAAAVARRGTAGQFDELRAELTSAGQPPAPLAPLWREFFTSLGPDGWADLRARQLRVQQRVREDGATYNIYAERGEADRPWPLETLPFIVSADDWAVIEQGVQQRAKLLEMALADIYGPQTLLRDALLPPALVFAHPQYLRPAHGLWPRGDIHLHIAAFDLARTPKGGFTVLAQRLQAPSGLGYLLENRLIIGPQFHDQFAALRVQRIASTFRSLLDGLMRASPAGERSRIVLLTPGPLNETYFEQVFLARYLGVTLVEGSDLTVRGKRLYLKTLHGLERVHVLLRRVDDEFLDPLELRFDSALGVPGLLQALRAGELVMANAPGAGFLESLGLSAFWPAVARELLGEDLLLPAPTTWWCGEEAVWEAQRERLEEFIVVPTFPGTAQGPQIVSQLDEAQRTALVARIDADPAAYTLLRPQRPSETPVWADGQLWPRAAVMRVFALADGTGGWRVLPGALTRVAGRDEAMHDPLLSMQRGSASVDTWVIARGAVDATSLLPKPLSVAELQGWHRTVSSRAAENLFWLGRYTERAENCARMARVMLEALPEGSEPVLQFFDALARRHGLVPAGVPTPQQSMRLFERALVHGLGDTDDLTSVAYNLRALRGCAKALRERLSPEHWKLIHEVGDHFEHHLAAVIEEGEGHAAPPDVLGVLARATTHLAAITGAQTDRMTRDDGWRLLSVGRQIERLDVLANALALAFECGVHEADDGFAAILGIFDSIITYRAQFQARREVLPLLHLLVLDTDNPRSLAWVARTMRDRLRKLARQDPAWVAEITDSLPTPDNWSLDALTAPDPAGRHGALIEALESCSDAARELSDQIGRHLFVHVVSPERSVWV
ncbi:circularly permuted type 2 ATP-grasp protein [Aquincola sp. S2]|uniref:Circularly permuted type 2 ATP-grasp protein n=1 Tax=Pseudaquabacterium terrae TaxID=2732868 RepID=A0ABX2EN13_9BURK|nr:circularly permuted type 2 ATP-grasp protein [Aquabacterium terrae]NRF70021.1 circularly permuted type 2 ATP-grasp protein [Aquabacterium terrae]